MEALQFLLIQQLNTKSRMWCYVPMVYFRNVEEAPQQQNSLSRQEKLPHNHKNTPQLQYDENPNIINSHSPQSHQKLILTRQDLLEAGYEPKPKMWSQEEDQLLRYYRDKCDLDWEGVAKHIPNRTARMCYNRHKRLVVTQKTPWKPKHDQKLLKLIEEYGEDWKTISTYLPKWNHFQIKSRYVNHLRPGQTHEDWSIDEDIELIQCINEYGRDWNRIQGRLPGRSLNQIQYRYDRRLKQLNQMKLEKNGLCDA